MIWCSCAIPLRLEHEISVFQTGNDNFSQITELRILPELLEKI